MAKKNRVTFRIKLRGPHGFAQLRYAKTYEIWYGKRRVFGPAPFPPKKKKVSERRSYLERRLNNIVREYNRLLAEVREKRRRKLAFKKKSDTQKELLRQKKVKSGEARKIKAKAVSPTGIVRKDLKEAFDYAYGDMPIFPKIRAEESEEYLNVVQIDKTVTPIEPDNSTYSKQLIDKMMWTSKSGYYNLAIIDFSLNPDEFIPMNADTFNEGYVQAYTIMFPHILNYYTESNRSSDAYILRIKFAWTTDRDTQEFDSYGISLHRQAYANRDGVLNAFRQTFLKMFGTKDPYDKTRLITTNYMFGDSMVYIKGFTFEAIKYDQL